MLRDGQFIREAPIHISSGYVPQFELKPTTPEEQVFQDWLLGKLENKESIVSKIFGAMLRI